MIAAEREQRVGEVRTHSSLRMVRCPIKRCDGILGAVRVDWVGQPIWIKCRKCGVTIRLDGDGPRAVARNGDD